MTVAYSILGFVNRDRTLPSETTVGEDKIPWNGPWADGGKIIRLSGFIDANGTLRSSLDTDAEIRPEKRLAETPRPIGLCQAIFWHHTRVRVS